MPNDKFLILVLGVIGAAGLTVWLAYSLAGAASPGLSVVLPVLMIAALALRFVLMRRRKDGADK